MQQQYYKIYLILLSIYAELNHKYIDYLLNIFAILSNINKYLNHKQSIIEFPMESPDNNLPNLSPSPFKSLHRDTFQLIKNLPFHNTQPLTKPTRQNKINPSDDKCYSQKISSLSYHNKLNINYPSNFIVIFQSIEILRLSQELQQSIQKINIYQKQSNKIQLLTNQCLILQKQIQQYKQELDKMNSICQKMFNQNKILKDQIKINKAQKKGIKAKQNDVTIQKMSQQIEKTIVQKKKLQKSLKKTKEESEKWQQIALKLTEESKRNTIESKNLKNLQNIPQNSSKEQQFSEQAKINKLSQQLCRLSQVLLYKNNQIWDLQKELITIKNSYKKQTIKSANQNKQQQINSASPKSQINQQSRNLLNDDQKCKSKFQGKEKQYYKNNIQIYKDITDINKLKAICQNQQIQITKNITEIKALTKSTTLYKAQLQTFEKCPKSLQQHPINESKPALSKTQNLIQQIQKKAIQLQIIIKYLKLTNKQLASSYKNQS